MGKSTIADHVSTLTVEAFLSAVIDEAIESEIQVIEIKKDLREEFGKRFLLVSFGAQDMQVDILHRRAFPVLDRILKQASDSGLQFAMIRFKDATSIKWVIQRKATSLHKLRGFLLHLAKEREAAAVS